MGTHPHRHAMRLVALPAAILAIAGVVTACGASSGASAGSSGTAEIKWAYDADLTNWDPVVDGANSTTQLLSTIYEPLFTLDTNGVPQPALASGWKYNSTGNQITITLKKGLTFQDGTPVNADAVKYNVDRILTQTNSALKGSYSDIKSATVLDDLDVRLDLKQTDYQIPYLLANRGGLLASEAAAKADPTKLNSSAPVGAGPFKVVKLVPESSVTLEKWPGYWDAKDIHVDKITISLQVSAATELSGFQTGVYNFGTNFPAQNLAAARKAGFNVVADTKRGWSTDFLSVNFNQAPFKDPRVFEAIQYAINRKQLVDNLTFGTGIVAYQPFPPSSPAYNPALDAEYAAKYPYDPEKAKQLLAAAGYQPGQLSFTDTTTTTLIPGLDELIQQQLSAVGIKMSIKDEQQAQYITDYYGKKVAFAPYGYVGRDSRVEALDELYGPDGVANLSSPIVSSQYQAAIAKVRQTPIDSPNYDANLQAATSAAVLNGGQIILLTQPQVYVTAKSFSAFPAIDGVFRWNGLTVK